MQISFIGASRGSKIGIVLGTVGGVIGLLTIGALFIICNGRRQGHLREVFVDVSGSVFAAFFFSSFCCRLSLFYKSCSLASQNKDVVCTL